MAFTDYDKIVLFGDSITEQSFDQTRGFAFGAALTQVYSRRMEVTARGFSGYNTLHALDILPRIIPPPSRTSRIRLITIFFGPNDATLKGMPQHVPLEQYANNLRKIITHPSLGRHSNLRIVLITPPPICEYRTQDTDRESGKTAILRLAAHTKKYADAALVVGRELGVPTLNLWEAFIRYVGGWKDGEPLPGSKELPRNEKFAELLRDGLHFEPKGYQILYDMLLKAIREKFPELAPEKLEYVFPRWEDAPKAVV